MKSVKNIVSFPKLAARADPGVTGRPCRGLDDHCDFLHLPCLGVD
jgi:hypothetical protein